MKEFYDGNNRKWLLNIKISSCKVVMEATNIDIATFPECINQLADIFVFSKILWLLIKGQAEKANVTEEDFYDSLDGEVVDKAFQAFLEEIVNFSPPQKRELLRKLIKKAMEHSETQMKIVEAQIESLNLNIPKESGNS